MNSSSRRIMPGFRLVAALVFFVAAGLLFAQTGTPADQTQVPAAPETTSAPEASAASAEETGTKTETPAAQAESSMESLFADAPAADRGAIAAAEGLVSRGKWLSAWTVLSEFDAANANPFILAEKIRVALDGYAQTTLHLVFGFVDLAEGENLEMARFNAVEIAEPVEFNPGDLAKAIEEKGEAIPPFLSLKLGDYYYTVWNTYQGQWLLSDEEILGMGVEGYERALAYDTYSAQSLGRQSEMLIALQRYDGAESAIAKALELEPENNALTLRLAEVYYSTGRYAEVYPLADKVIGAATDDNELNDGYVVGIKTGLATTDKEALEKYISGLEKSFPADYMPGLIRHLAAVQLGDGGAADAAADVVTEAFPGDPDVIRSLVSTWLSANDPDSGFRYLERSIAKAPLDDAMAALYFYKALLAGEVAMAPEDLTGALADLATAEEYFKKSYPEGHEVFAMIEEIRVQWNESINPPRTEESAAAATESAPAAEKTPTVESPPALEPAAPVQGNSVDQ